MADRFRGKTVLISGATGGFGKVAAQMFADQGANLVLTDFDKKSLDDFTRKHDAKYDAKGDAKCRKCVSLAGDIAVEKTSSDLVDLAMSQFGRLDYVINNAGIAHTQAKLPDLESSQAQKVMDVNVLGVFYAMKHQIPAMEKTHKNFSEDTAIVNVASLAGLVGAPTMSLYVAAKHAVVGMTKAAALEFARKGVRINALCPAFARTPIVTKDLLGASQDPMAAEQHLVRGIPMRRLAEPQEITQAMLWLCDPQNTFMTGHALAIDGGVTAF